MAFQADTFGDTVLIGGRADGLHTSTDEYNHPMGGYTWRTDTANFDRQCLFPAPGTLRDLHVDLDEAPGGSGSYTFDIDAGDLQFDIDDPDEVGNSGSKTHSVSSGDDIRISVSPTGPTNSPQAKWGFNFRIFEYCIKNFLLSFY